MTTKIELENKYNRLYDDYIKLKDECNKIRFENENYKNWNEKLGQKYHTIVDSISNILSIHDVRELFKTIVVETLEEEKVI